jgi:hypothetical protein
VALTVLVVPRTATLIAVCCPLVPQPGLYLSQGWLALIVLPFWPQAHY